MTSRGVPTRYGSRPLGDYKGVLLILLSWALSRIAMTVLLVVDAEAAGTSDLARYHSVAYAVVRGEGIRSLEYWEYPIGALAVVIPPIYAAADHLDYIVLFTSMAMLFDLAALAGVLLSSPRGSLNVFGGWIWLIAPPSLGVLGLTRLDVIACALAVVALSICLRRGWAGAAGFLLALGAAIKVWPGLLILPLLDHARSKTRVAVGVSTATVLILSLIQLFGWWSLSTSFLEHQTDRGVQIESFAALPLMWLDQLNIVNYSSEFAFGARELRGPGVDVVAAVSTLLMFASLAGLVVFALAGGFHGRIRTEERLVVFCTLVVSVLIVTNKVFSSQYMLWLTVMVAALCGWRRPDLRMAAAVVGASVLTHLIFPLFYAGLVAEQIGVLSLLTARDALVVYVVWRVVAPVLGPTSPRPANIADRRRVSEVLR